MENGKCNIFHSLAAARIALTSPSLLGAHKCFNFIFTSYLFHRLMLLHIMKM